MRFKVAAILIIMFFAGTVVVPAGYLPCLCQTAKALNQNKPKTCCSGQSEQTSSCSGSERTAPSCCATQKRCDVSPIGKSIGCKCSTCPVANRVQMVAHSGSGQAEVFSGSPTSVAAIFDVVFPDAEEILTYLGEDAIHPIGITVLSRTCALLI